MKLFLWQVQPASEHKVSLMKKVVLATGLFLQDLFCSHSIANRVRHLPGWGRCYYPFSLKKVQKIRSKIDFVDKSIKNFKLLQSSICNVTINYNLIYSQSSFLWNRIWYLGWFLGWLAVLKTARPDLLVANFEGLFLMFL